MHKAYVLHYLGMWPRPLLKGGPTGLGGGLGGWVCGLWVGGLVLFWAIWPNVPPPPPPPRAGGGGRFVSLFLAFPVAETFLLKK